MSCWTDLDDPLLCAILSWLPGVKQKWQLAVVCKSFAAALQQPDAHSVRTADDDECFKLWQGFIPLPVLRVASVLRIVEWRIDPQSRTEDPLNGLLEVPDILTHLRYLSIACYGDVLERLGAHFPMLTTILIYFDIGDAYSAPSHMPLRHYWPQLERVDIGFGLTQNMSELDIECPPGCILNLDMFTYHDVIPLSLCTRQSLTTFRTEFGQKEETWTNCLLPVLPDNTKLEKMVLDLTGLWSAADFEAAYADELSFALVNLEELNAGMVVEMNMLEFCCHRLYYNQAVVLQHRVSPGQDGTCTVSLTL